VTLVIGRGVSKGAEDKRFCGGPPTGWPSHRVGALQASSPPLGYPKPYGPRGPVTHDFFDYFRRNFELVLGLYQIYVCYICMFVKHMSNICLYQIHVHISNIKYISYIKYMSNICLYQIYVHVSNIKYISYIKYMSDLRLAETT
jgi:hypothetical protein